MPGSTERTLRRWLTEDLQFKTAYDNARRLTFEAAMNRIQALSVRAVDTLEDLLGEKKHPAVRLGAARTIAEMGMHHQDAETILHKLNDIEAAQRLCAPGRR